MDQLLEVLFGLKKGSGKGVSSLCHHSFLYTQPSPSTDKGTGDSIVPQWSGGLKKPKSASSSLPLCLGLIRIENSGSPFYVSYLSMKGFRMVVPSKKNMRTEKPIIANPSSMARSSPALDGSFLCTSGKAPSSWSIFLLLPEAEKAVLWRKQEGVISVSSWGNGNIYQPTVGRGMILFAVHLRVVSRFSAKQ